MSKVITPQKTLMRQSNDVAKNKATPTVGDTISLSSLSGVDFDDFTSSSSIIEFLTKEQECCSETDAESIFREVNRLAGGTDTRSVDEILREAELLMEQQQALLGGVGNCILQKTQAKQSIKLNSKYTKRIENVRPPSATRLTNGRSRSPTPPQATSVSKTKSDYVGEPSDQTRSSTPLTPCVTTNGKNFAAFVDSLPSESVISEESTPKDMQTLTCTEKDISTAQLHDDVDTDDGTDTMEEITEGMETIELVVNEEPCLTANSKNVSMSNNAPANEPSIATVNASSSSLSMSMSLSVSGSSKSLAKRGQHTRSTTDIAKSIEAPSSSEPTESATTTLAKHAPSPSRRTPLNFSNSQECSNPSTWDRRNSLSGRQALSTSDSGFSHNSPTQLLNRISMSTFCDKGVNSSPRLMVSTMTSPVQSAGSISREHHLKQEIEQLRERLKDTEERLQSLRIQHDSLSALHRDLRESNTHLQEESELLKLDVQHLNECANVLRSELQAARADREEALELQKALQSELDEFRQEKKRTQEQKDKDGKTIQDLQRQCREMERILMRKYPDSVSALIVASKNPNSNGGQENSNSRKLLEQRIAQLESDAKEQDHKAQQILANVQARFNAVQAKYETHIADLETQVLSLQEINTKLNEKIESQVRTLDYFMTKKAEQFYNNATQTDPCPQAEGPIGEHNTHSMSTQTASSALAMRDHSTNTIGTTSNHGHSASSSTSSTANSTPNNSRPNSKQSGLRKPMAGSALTTMLSSKLPISVSDSTIVTSSATSLHAAAASAKEDAHLIATIRGMRVDLAIKEKAVNRLTRELDECKKTIKKLQREKDAIKADRSHHSHSGMASSSSRRSHDADHMPANTESQALKEAQSKMKLLEADYKTLHEKRLQDLKTLQSAHERELASYHETVRVLQQRLSERDEAFGTQKRRKVPVDYYALKAKVSSLERRHSEREERLHLLVEALSKGRLNGALEDLLRENNNQ